MWNYALSPASAILSTDMERDRTEHIPSISLYTAQFSNKQLLFKNGHLAIYFTSIPQSTMNNKKVVGIEWD